MGANVVTDEEAYSDVRFEILAGLVGFADADHALVKMQRVWLWCIKHRTDIVPVSVISAILRTSSSGAQQPSSSIQQLLGPLDRGGADLAEPAGDGLVRIKGCDQHRTFWYDDRRKADKSAGGKARAAAGARDGAGRFSGKSASAGHPLDQQTDQQRSSDTPADVQHGPALLDQQHPATPASDSEIPEIPSASARSPEPGARSAGHDSVARVANELRVERADVVRRVQADGIDRGAPGSGMGIGTKGETDAVRMVSAFLAREPQPADPPGEQPSDRARRLGRYVLSMLEVDARHNGSVAKLREANAFTESTVDWALNTTPSAIRADRPRSEWGKPAGATSAVSRKGPLKVGELVDGKYRVERGER